MTTAAVVWYLVFSIGYGRGSVVIPMASESDCRYYERIYSDASSNGKGYCFKGGFTK